MSLKGTVYQLTSGGNKKHSNVSFSSPSLVPSRIIIFVFHSKSTSAFTSMLRCIGREESTENSKQPLPRIHKLFSLEVLFSNPASSLYILVMLVSFLLVLKDLQKGLGSFHMILSVISNESFTPLTVKPQWVKPYQGYP